LHSNTQMDQSANDLNSESMSGSFHEGTNDPHKMNTTEGIGGHGTDRPPTEISRYHLVNDPSP
jgi:hypothetical protein